MTKIKEIHELLQNIQSGVSEKLEEQQETLERKKRIDKEAETNLNAEIIQKLKESLEHTKGQLYEVTYILDNFWEIISK